MSKQDKSKRVAGRGQVTTQRSVVAEYQGPIPPPQMLARYEEIVPGAGERILAMAEKEQQNRHSMNWLGLIGGSLLWGGVLYAAVRLAELDARTAAAIVGSGVGLPLLARFFRWMFRSGD